MQLRILKSGIHRGEELLVQGNERAGMIVFSGCHLSCRFCYTPETSVYRLGTDVNPEQFSLQMASLLARGAHNINLISPSHVWEAIHPVLTHFKQGPGAAIPLILKVSGFEMPAQVAQFAAVGDVLVPDLKVIGEAEARSVDLPGAYGVVALKAIEEMARTHTPCLYDQGQMVRGMIVRHLLMPGFEADSERVVSALAGIGYRGVFNLMTHFVDPKKGLMVANEALVSDLAERAARAGMYVLVDGTDRYFAEEAM